MTDIRDDLLAAVEKWRAEVSRLTAALAESERRRVEMIDRHEAERRVLAADVCRQADRAEAAEKEAERQRMFWEGIRDARVDAAERSLVGARAMADDFKRRAEEHAALQAAAERREAEAARTVLSSQSHPLAEVSAPTHRQILGKRGQVKIGREAEFLVAARTAVPALIAALRASRGRRGGQP